MSWFLPPMNRCSCKSPGIPDRHGGVLWPWPALPLGTGSLWPADAGRCHGSFLCLLNSTDVLLCNRHTNCPASTERLVNYLRGDTALVYSSRCFWLSTTPKSPPVGHAGWVFWELMCHTSGGPKRGPRY